MSATFAERLAAYLARAWGGPVTIEALARISGGASRETYRFDAVTAGARKPLILRRDPPGSLIETDRRLEFMALKSFHGRGVAAPEPLILEREGAELERPFFIMARVDGGATASPFSPDPYAPHAAELGRDFFATLGRIAAADPATLPIADVAETPAPDACWRRELDYWADVIDADEQHPQPIVRAAIRRLRAHPPPPAQKLAVVHGDYRSGNFLHDGAGRIVAVLDWEMAHIGDPLEDLAWALDPLWRHGETERVAGMLPKADAIAVWEDASGLKVDPEAFRWWELFASVKGQAIWISSAKEYRDGGFSEPVLCFSGWVTARRQDEILAAQLAERWPL
ncbi:MAG TPA: phosphotransferase family protein [Caulobacteraceae bacterium]|nr:phosphotransferase family protein [Caulobacteraceae bacterium]